MTTAEKLRRGEVRKKIEEIEEARRQREDEMYNASGKPTTEAAKPL